MSYANDCMNSHDDLLRSLHLLCDAAEAFLVFGTGHPDSVLDALHLARHEMRRHHLDLHEPFGRAG